MNSITITRPDDWHVHFRDGAMLQETVPATARCFGRALVMPNLVPPVTDAQKAIAYRDRISQHIRADSGLVPMMTLYLTNATTSEDIRAAKAAGVVACKLYPAGATTNSDAAVSGIQSLYPVFETMAEVGLLLLIHGEVTDTDIDIFDREKVFIDRYLIDITETFPHLKVVSEHITTKDAAQFVSGAHDNVAATITPQHLLMNRNDLLVGGVKPHNYCLPILKRNIHQQALQELVATGTAKVFLGTDSAPHTRANKENSCGCAGCYSAWSAIELYAQIFDELGILDKLEAFASFHGADFYGVPRNPDTITLTRSPWTVPESIALPEDESIVPFYAGKTLRWKLAD